MAATVSSVWAKPGAWALDSEQHEDELTLQHQLDLASPQKEAAPVAEFPSLSAAVTAKPKKKTKQVLSLAQFSNYKPPSQAAATEVVLPTGPRERTAEEIAEARRGGFRNYGGDRGGDREGRPRVSRDGFDGERDMGPSRADEADDWSRGKKVSSFGSGNGSERERERDMGPSRADGVDDWSKGKKLGSGFGVERSERREKVGFFNSSRADEVDNWGAKKQSGSFGSGFGEDRRRERRAGFEAVGPGSDVDSWVKKGSDNGGNVGSGGGAGGRPRLNLQPRTLPVVVASVENNDAKSNGNGDLNGGVVEVVKPKGNPFGAARPREEVLKEKGQDWKEIDEKLEAVKIKEKEKEKEGERSSFDSIGRRRGVGVGGANGAVDSVRNVGAWRKPDSPSYAAVAVAPPAPRSAEKAAEPETTEKAPEDN